MNASNFDLSMLYKMAHSRIDNYIIPGLSSSLIGMPGPKGLVRLFECSRDHQENVTPHSHRFDFQCWVLAGSVTNRIWTRSTHGGDWFRPSELRYGGAVGEYETVPQLSTRYDYHDMQFDAGDCYSMTAAQIHSIRFSRGAKVLFLEGETIRNMSIILEPEIDGEVIPTFKVEPWMFKRSR